ncbi:MAG: NTP transferase domain-containing protein [Planctomycetes bacterium]|nr:NTP transferase domain-containing protein [Planctomycetota bacterium]
MSLNNSLKPIGVLLAAGRGRRLGGGKQFYPWPTVEGEKPLVAAAFDAVASVCDAMIVVLGHRAAEVAAALGERQFRAVQSDPDAPMFESIRVGIQAALETSAEAPVLLQPGDHPEVQSATLEQILTVSGEHPDRAIVPEFQGRGGHPVLIPAGIAQRLLTTDCPQGLGQYWSDHPKLCLRVSVNDGSVVRDVDTAVD